MTRGQAFDTMMLVISVIVAMAILAVLLGFIKGIPVLGQEPVNIIRTDISNVQQAGFGVQPAQKLVFTKDSLVLREAVTANLPIRPEEVAFACYSGSVICGDNALVVSDNSMDAKQDLTAYGVVCGNERSGTSDVLYCVGIGRNSAEARDACVARCNIQT